MTVADITFVAFTFCNSARVVAYVPQIAKAATDQQARSHFLHHVGRCSSCECVCCRLRAGEQGGLDHGLDVLANAIGCIASSGVGA